MEPLPSFINSQSRNKLVIHNKTIFGIEPIDVGKELAIRIKAKVNDSKIGIRSFLILEDLLSEATKESELYGRYIAIENLGILFEEELKLDFKQILSKYSLSNTLFVKWEGEIENQNLYFLTKKKGKVINIKNISHIII